MSCDVSSGFYLEAAIITVEPSVLPERIIASEFKLTQSNEIFFCLFLCLFKQVP